MFAAGIPDSSALCILPSCCSFVSFFPDKTGVVSGFIGNVLHIHFLGSSGTQLTRFCVWSVLVAVYKHRIVLAMCET